MRTPHRTVDMTIYGLFTLYHHGGTKVLTVMSDRGAKAALAYVETTDGIITRPRPGYLTQYLGAYKGALERFIESNGIRMLDKRDWDRKKLELGAAITG